MEIRCLTYNVSYRSISGTRNGVYVIYDKTGTKTQIMSSKDGNLPGSREFEYDAPCKNILKYLVEEHTKYDIVHLIEADQVFINRLKTQISTNYRIIRFWAPDMDESCFVLVNKRHQIVDAVCLGIGIPKRAIGVIVFENFVYVGVHLPHTKNKAEIEMLSSILTNSLKMVVGKDSSIIIGGDFNHESELEEFRSAIPSKPTAFVYVPLKYVKLGEHPFQHTYDRFVHSKNIQLKSVNTIENDLLKSGYMSDHLPCEATFSIEPIPHFRKERSSSITVGESPFLLSIYQKNVGTPDPNSDSVRYYPISTLLL